MPRLTLPSVPMPRLTLPSFPGVPVPGVPVPRLTLPSVPGVPVPGVPVGQRAARSPSPASPAVLLLSWPWGLRLLRSLCFSGLLQLETHRKVHLSTKYTQRNPVYDNWCSLVNSHLSRKQWNYNHLANKINKIHFKLIWKASFVYPVPFGRSYGGKAHYQQCTPPFIFKSVSMPHCRIWQVF